jgi:uncharacterized protein (DUF362 family)
MPSEVVALKTSPETVLDDYQKLIDIAGIERIISPDQDSLIKLNLSWTKYFPSCSSQPWQVEGVVRALLRKGYRKERLLPVENKTVVTDPVKGARNNLWSPVLEKYGLPFFPLTDVEWAPYDFKTPLLKMNQVFPEGFVIPKMFAGKNIIHLPTVKTHGHSVTTGAVKNAFGGLLKEVRHYAHKYIHEILVDLMIMQKELHPGIFCVMDGTVCGDGAGPRTMKPCIGNILLASGDSVAIDSVAARVMGFDPMSIPYIRMCHERGLGTGDPGEIEIVGDDIAGIDLHFKTKKSLVIWGDQMLRIGFLRFLERILLHSPLVVWAPFASNVYHDGIWYPTVGRHRIKAFEKTEWGKLWLEYKKG